MLLIYPSAQVDVGIASAQSESEPATVYTPFDKVIIRIYSPDSNQNRNEIDTIAVLITGSFSQKEFLLRETGLNTSIFEKDIRLSPDLSKFPGDVQTRREDGLSVTFRIDSNTVVTQSIFINYHVGKASFDKSSYGLGEQARIIVQDRDMNRNPDTIDTVSARIWSNTDRGGLFVTLRETGASTGIFEEFIAFTMTEESSGTRLRVTDGDNLVLKYTDSTLPPPAPLKADGIETVEVQEIFAYSIFGTKPAFPESVSSSEPSLLDYNGERLTKINAGEHVIIKSEITNNRNAEQPFMYIVQVKNEDGSVVSLSWLASELASKGSFVATQSWLPLVPGHYMVETFVWEDLEKAIVLSETRSTTVQVF
jgi:hypothetical protein